ncbi:hypothetical protein, partial [Sphaerisporangium sp. TRM90804]|uniref:hypothetical protein n=1 Tax=Sphaerisporangium sp. TRM90804 TaxID=3031113 RepID=UPI0024493268
MATNASGRAVSGAAFSDQTTASPAPKRDTGGGGSGDRWRAAQVVTVAGRARDDRWRAAQVVT